MLDVILALNAGSSSIKFSLFSAGSDTPEPLLGGKVEGLHTAPRFVARDPAGTSIDERRWPEGTSIGHGGAVAHLVGFLRGYRDRYRLCAAGHRIVHGGLAYSAPVRIDAGVVAALEALTPLAPLHQPHNLAPVRALLEQAPELPQVACFDTAFHRSQPELAQAFALPAEITRRGVRRYGFHGLSYEFIASALPALDPRAAAGRVVVAHLGNGASMCAIAGGRSVAATTGLTAVDGLPMGTRSGTLDPGVLLYLMDELSMDARAIENLIYKESGLLGVSGISSDMRTLLASDAPGAREAVDLFVYRIRRELGSLAAAMDGIDAPVFTGDRRARGRNPRARLPRRDLRLGPEFDAGANGEGGARISTAASRVSAWVIPTNEELMIARHTRRLIAAPDAKE
ncbi:acetate/propionate family kinase [Pseudoxanthomonas sp. NC8]|nr:acetate/propionate family kinase [Pseudoxanthomonas sp. NC8]